MFYHRRTQRLTAWLCTSARAGWSMQPHPAVILRVKSLRGDSSNNLLAVMYNHVSSLPFAKRSCIVVFAMKFEHRSAVMLRRSLFLSPLTAFSIIVCTFRQRKGAEQAWTWFTDIVITKACELYYINHVNYTFTSWNFRNGNYINL